ncbi:MAG: autotransporter assembly complex family protein [Pseudomonadota bacterium]
MRIETAIPPATRAAIARATGQANMRVRRCMCLAASVLGMCLGNVAWAFDVGFAAPDLAPDAIEDVRRASLVVQLKAQPPDTVTAQDIVAAARADYGRLVGALYDLGYFGPAVSIRIDGREAAGIPVLAGPQSVQRVDVVVRPGPVFRFGVARLAPLPPGAQPPDGFAAGRIATTGAMRGAVDSGVAAWRAQGHAKARLAEQSITARHPANRIDADIRLDPGPRLRFGRLRVSGARAVRTDRISDIAGLPSGTVFDPGELERAATRLRRTGAFNTVSLTEADRIGPNGTIDIDAQITEAKPRRFGFGAEVSTEEGLTLSAFWLHRNLLGGAERLRVDGEISGIQGDTGGEDFELSFAFNRPATFNEDTDLYVSGSVESRNEPSLSFDRLILETGIVRHATAEREYSLGIGLERANSDDVFGARSYTLLTLPARATFDYRDDPLNARSGYFINAELTPFAGLGDSGNGLRSYVDARVYRSFGAAETVTLALRGQLGSVAGSSLPSLPADFLFFSGGGGTVRGHDYQSLGVPQGAGLQSGGRSFLGLSTELRVRTGDRLSIVGFVDAGYVGPESFPDGSSGRWHSGAGAGIRYDTGLGPIRVDLAVPVSGPGDTSGFQAYIGIGQAY